MDYESVIEWMYHQIPMYQRVGNSAYKADLETTRKLDACFGYPHKAFKTIHVGGTNGKGSVSHMLASVLQASGYKTGLYTSPHLKDFRERIKVNGEPVDKAYVVNFVDKHREFFKQVHSSFFEMTVAMAFDYFRAERVDIAVVEVGLGGRLDSTNIIDPQISVITNISLDHTQFLGHTVEAIAREKAGIIKPGRPVVVGEYDPDTALVFQEKARRCGAPLAFADKEFRVEPVNREQPEQSVFRVWHKDELLYPNLVTDLHGIYQSKNLATVLKCIDTISSLGIVVNHRNIVHGLAKVVSHTSLLGRWQIMNRDPLTICDIAHNAAGLSGNIQALRTMKTQNLHFVLGFVSDKDMDTILPLFPGPARYYFTKANIPRALDEQKLRQQAGKYALHGEAYEKSADALIMANCHAGPHDVIYVGGSTFVVSELI